MNFKEQLQDQLLSLEKEYNLKELFFNYYQKILFLLIILLAFYLGRFVVKNSLEQYLDYFQNFLQQQERIKSRINLVKKIQKLFKISYYIIPVIASSLFYLINTEDFQNKSLNYKQLIQVLFAEKLNQFLICIVIGFFLVHTIVEYFINKYMKWQESKLKDIQGNQKIYVSKFFDYIGDDLKEQLRIYLIGDKKNPEIKNYLKQIQEEKKQNELLQKNTEQLNTKIQIQKEFIEQITSFNWCKFCYNSNENNDSQSQSQVANENSSEKNQCEQNCLYKYLMFCEKIAREYFDKIKKVNQFQIKIVLIFYFHD